jgi:group I intron endonuclease
MVKLYYIYFYENKINGKVYIGQTNNIKIRYGAHKVAKDKSMPIDRAIGKYGIDNFIFYIIKIVDTLEQSNEEEIYWIAEMRRCLGKKNVYNIADGGKNKSVDKVTRAKISKSHLGKSLSEEHKSKISKGNKGKKVVHSLETRKKMSQSAQIKIFNEDHRKNLSIAQIGRKHSEATKDKIRGKNSVRAKLNNIKAEEIRSLYATGNYTSRQLAKQFNLGKSTILRVINSISWSNK